MTKVKKVLSWLNNGCYPGYVMFSCGFNYDEIVKLLKKKNAKDWLLGLRDEKDSIDQGHYMAMRRTIENTKTGKKLTMFYIILRPEFKFTDYEYCKLAHEIVHICQFFLPDILNRNNEPEAEAYYHTHLMNQCLEALRGNKK